MELLTDEELGTVTGGTDGLMNDMARGCAVGALIGTIGGLPGMLAGCVDGAAGALIYTGITSAVAVFHGAR